MARAMEPAPSPPEAGYRGCHSPVTRLLPSLGCRAAALSGGAVPHLSRRRFSLCALPQAARSPTRSLPNYCQALRARRVEGKASGVVSQGNLSPELSSSPRWDASSASSLETNHPEPPCLTCAAPSSPPLWGQPQTGPRAQARGRRSSKEEQQGGAAQFTCTAKYRGQRGARWHNTPSSHTSVGSVCRGAVQEAFLSPPPLVQAQAAQCIAHFSLQPLSEVHK